MEGEILAKEDLDSSCSSNENKTNNNFISIIIDKKKMNYDESSVKHAYDIIFGKVSGKKFERKRGQLLFLEKKPKLGQGEGGGKPAGDLSNFLSMFNIKQIN